MSDSYLRIIPADENLVPSEAVVAQILEVVAPAFPEADEIIAESHGHPVFIDQGINLRAILCPSCAARLSLEPAGESGPLRAWWSSLTSPLKNKSVADVRATMPCCHKLVPFSRLRFDPPTGVASFELSIVNPGGAALPSREVQEQLESVLGCPVRYVRASY